MRPAATVNERRFPSGFGDVVPGRLLSPAAAESTLAWVRFSNPRSDSDSKMVAYTRAAASCDCVSGAIENETCLKVQCRFSWLIGVGSGHAPTAPPWASAERSLA